MDLDTCDVQDPVHLYQDEEKGDSHPVQHNQPSSSYLSFCVTSQCHTTHALRPSTHSISNELGIEFRNPSSELCPGGHQWGLRLRAVRSFPTEQGKSQCGN
jgi:hypothetical protein